jgi:hypothetical protein
MQAPTSIPRHARCQAFMTCVMRSCDSYMLRVLRESLASHSHYPYTSRRPPMKNNSHYYPCKNVCFYWDECAPARQTNKQTKKTNARTYESSSVCVIQIGERIEKVDVDGDVLKAFMRTKALEGMAGAILYTGILEFMQKADVLGNVVNQLPIIGPVRQQVNVALKDVVSCNSACTDRALFMCSTFLRCHAANCASRFSCCQCA